MLRAEHQADPANPVPARRLAELLERSGRPRAALLLRREILAHAGDRDAIVASKLELAFALVESNQLPEAIQLLHQVLAADATNEPAAFELGTALARSEDFAAAYDAFAAAARWKPEDAEAQLSAAKSLITLLRCAEAEPYLEAAARARGESAETHSLRGTIYGSTGREEQAVVEWEKAAVLDPSDAQIQLHLGVSLMHLGRATDATGPLERAVALDPTIPAYFQLTKAYHALGKPEQERKAVASLQALQQEKVADTKVVVLKNEAEGLVASKEYAKAAETYQSALALRPEDCDLLYRLAMVHGLMRDPEGERALLLRVLARSPEHIGALVELGILEGMQGQTAAAKRHLRDALRLDPQRADALSNLAVLVGREGDLAAARTMLTNAVESDPRNPTASRNLGLIDAADGRTAEAEAALRKSIALDPQDAVSELALGQVLAGEHKPAQAVNELRTAVALAPDNPAARLSYAQALLAAGDSRSALEETRRLLEMAPNLAEGIALRNQLCHAPEVDAQAALYCAKASSR